MCTTYNSVHDFPLNQSHHFIFFLTWTVSFFKEISLSVFAKHNKTRESKIIMWDTCRKSWFCSSSLLKPHVLEQFGQITAKHTKKEKKKLGLSFLNICSEQIQKTVITHRELNFNCVITLRYNFVRDRKGTIPNLLT